MSSSIICRSCTGENCFCNTVSDYKYDYEFIITHYNDEYCIGDMKNICDRCKKCIFCNEACDYFQGGKEPREIVRWCRMYHEQKRSRRIIELINEDQARYIRKILLCLNKFDQCIDEHNKNPTSKNKLELKNSRQAVCAAMKTYINLFGQNHLVDNRQLYELLDEIF